MTGLRHRCRQPGDEGSAWSCMIVQPRVLAAHVASNRPLVLLGRVTEDNAVAEMGVRDLPFWHGRFTNSRVSSREAQVTVRVLPYSSSPTPQPEWEGQSLVPRRHRG